ncbi:hypothetical protein CRUP_009014 [Coryphaenoides rupestris]|nr:hypothetical protein CRUP_009014 [Coryphaenoides rupestris]
MQYYHQEWAHAAAHVVVPPLRLDPNTPNYLMGLLGNDTLSVLASEHRPFCTKQRALGKEDFTKIPHGLAGVQDRMSVLWERGVVGTHTCTHTHARTRTHARSLTHSHTHTCTHAHTHAHAYTYIHTYIHRHTHTHSYIKTLA